MNIGIIGFGRFGQLLAEMLKESHSIKVYDIIDKTEGAKKIGVKWSKLNEICLQDFIILCVPISKMKNVLEKIKDKIKKGTVVMDTCSVKEYPAELMLKNLSKKTELIASHPMFGPDSAKYGLKNLQIIFCPLRISKEKTNKIEEIFKKMGLTVIELTPKEHDEQSAMSLCLVHFLGRGLEKMQIAPQKITTLGFERLLKVQETVTNDTFQLFEDMQNYNRFAVVLRKKLIQSLESIHKKLDNE